MQRADNSNLRSKRYGRLQKSSGADFYPSSRLNSIVSNIVATVSGSAHGNNRLGQRGNIGKHVFIFLFLVLVTAYVVVQLSSREGLKVHNDDRVVVSTQHDFVQPLTESEEGIDVGHIAPDFTLANLYGKEVKLSDYRGTVVVLEFWASWCPPCNAAMPKLIDLQERYNNKDFIILAIAVDKGTDVNGKLLKFAAEHKVDYPILVNNDVVTKAYKVNSVPTTFIIDKKGQIVHKYIGLDENSYEQTIPAKIESLLQE